MQGCHCQRTSGKEQGLSNKLIGAQARSRTQTPARTVETEAARGGRSFRARGCSRRSDQRSMSLVGGRHGISRCHPGHPQIRQGERPLWVHRSLVFQGRSLRTGSGPRARCHWSSSVCKRAGRGSPGSTSSARWLRSVRSPTPSSIRSWPGVRSLQASSTTTLCSLPLSTKLGTRTLWKELPSTAFASASTISPRSAAVPTATRVRCASESVALGDQRKDAADSNDGGEDDDSSLDSPTHRCRWLCLCVRWWVRR